MNASGSRVSPEAAVANTGKLDPMFGSGGPEGQVKDSVRIFEDPDQSNDAKYIATPDINESFEYVKETGKGDPYPVTVYVGNIEDSQAWPASSALQLFAPNMLDDNTGIAIYGVFLKVC